MTSDPAPLTVDDARARIARAIVPIVACETVALDAALGRVLAEDCVASVDVPPHRNSAMDGFALSAATAQARTARIVGVARAGHPHRAVVAPGDCVRITTGAVLPDGCDAVVPLEYVDATSDRIALREPVHAGRHVREAGEDLRRGAIAIARGRRLRPVDLGLAASLGVDRLEVRRRPRVAVFSTGDELLAPNEAPRVGALRDSNRPALIASLTSMGVDVVDLGIVRDEPERLAAVLDETYAMGADAIVTSGGVSTGDADHTRSALAARGDVVFWKLAVKPGRPMAFGTLKGRDGPVLFFGLPGNPVAALVGFEVFVRDALLSLAGALGEPRWTLVARVAERIAKQPGRTEFVRGIATRAGDGWVVHPTRDQGSGVLRSLGEANCLVVLAHDRGDVAIDERVEVWPLHGVL